MAQSHANKTATLIWDQYRGTTTLDRVDSCDVELVKPLMSEANKKFLQANMKFKDLCDIIVEICNKNSCLNLGTLPRYNRYMLAGAPESVKNYVLVSVNQVNSCNQELLRPPRERSDVLEANVKLKDLCSIILAICNKVHQ
ncbi:hypothetical protein Salat_2910600 [Sesamum alatum]|uniref:Pectinesterase inhibitor domain-containing protein n=1 Tax=Sesamum alatum TaxID=300844 RepID=A0AAE1XIL6_9LAMI|nr:hypothetical protein Salat_2910600 [Sesamum alatum]